MLLEDVVQLAVTDKLETRGLENTLPNRLEVLDKLYIDTWGLCIFTPEYKFAVAQQLTITEARMTS